MFKEMAKIREIKISIIIIYRNLLRYFIFLPKLLLHVFHAIVCNLLILSISKVFNRICKVITFVSLICYNFLYMQYMVKYCMYCIYCMYNLHLTHL